MTKIEWERRRYERFHDLFYHEWMAHPPVSADRHHPGRLEQKRSCRPVRGTNPRSCGRGSNSPEGKFIIRVIEQLDDELPIRLVDSFPVGGRGKAAT